MQSNNKHPSFAPKPTPTLQLLAKLSKFQGERSNNINNKALNTNQSAFDSSDAGQKQPIILPSMGQNRVEQTLNSTLDPNFKPQISDQDNPTKAGHYTYNSHMNSNVGKLFKGSSDEVPEITMPSKRLNDPTISNFNNNLIGGQNTNGDPFQTTAQMMMSGENAEKKLSSKKKPIKGFEPELFVSPITGEPIADYGNWKQEIGKTKESKHNEPVDNTPDDPIMAKLKSQLALRGAKGVVGLGRVFKIADDDGSKTLSFSEFKKAMKDFGMVLSDTELILLFKRFDLSKAGVISYNDFLTTIAGALNSRRRRLVNMAFDVLDKDKSGEINISDIAFAYNTSKHPDIISGKKSVEQVLGEVLEGFDVGGTKDGKVTREEFENYYASISASVDKDDYFELMIRNAWHISGGEGDAANSSNRRVLVTRPDGTQAVVEIKDDLGLKPGDKAGMIARLKAQGEAVASISLFDGGDDNNNSNKGSTGKGPLGRGKPANSSAIRGKQGSSLAPVQQSAAPSAGIILIINKIKAEMKSRGSGGFVGLQRRFKIMDDDGNKSLSLAEFKKALKEFKMDLSEGDLRSLFEHFDSDRSGSIDFDEFIQGVREPLNDRRLRLVHQAFTILDKDGSGVVDATEIATMYDASKHPEVMAKRKTPSQVLKEFLDTFDVGGEKDGKVTKDEFTNYYTNIGANIDNDDYFELMIRNAWHMSGGQGASASSANMTVLVTDSSGRESTVTLQNDLGVKKDDIPQIFARLRSQGVSDVYAINGKLIKVLNINGIDVVTTQGEAMGVNNKMEAPKVLKAPPMSRPHTASFQSRGGPNRPRPIAGADPAPGFGGAGSASLQTNQTQLASNVMSQLSNQQAYSAQAAQIKIIGNTLLDVLKVQLLSKGAAGIIELQRKFIEMDSDGSKALDLNEFKTALIRLKLAFSDKQVEMLFTFLDRDKSGTIDYDELLQGLRGPMNPRLLVLVHQVFDRLDSSGSGSISPQDLILSYDASRHPDVSVGSRSADQVLKEFLDTFDVGGVQAGRITREEFVNYYNNISATTNDDDFMELIVRRTWHLNEDPRFDAWGNQLDLASATGTSSGHGHAGSSGIRGKIVNAQTFDKQFNGGRAATAGSNVRRNSRNGQSEALPTTNFAMPIPDQRFSSSNSRGSTARQPPPTPGYSPASGFANNLLDEKIQAMQKNAISLFNAGDYIESEQVFRSVLQLMQSIYPPNHPECVKLEKSILMVQRKAMQPR